MTPTSGVPHHHTPCWSLLKADLRDVLAKLHEGTSQLTWEEQESVASLAWSAYTVTLDEEGLVHQFSWLTSELAREAVSLARRLQEHTCNDLCSTHAMEGQKCKLYFPRLPSYLTQLAMPPDIKRRKDREDFLAPCEALQGKVQEVLRDLRRSGQLGTTSLDSLLRTVDPDLPQYNEDGDLSWSGIIVPRGPDLNLLLERCGEMLGLGLGQEEVLRAACWQWCLRFRHFARVILARRVGESYMASYSPAILLTAKTNHEVELITSTPNKVFNYVTKGGVASSKEGVGLAVRELRRRGEEERATELESMFANFDVRLVSTTEAIYRIAPGLSLAASNVGIVYRQFEDKNTVNSTVVDDEEDEDHYENDGGVVDKDYSWR